MLKSGSMVLVFNYCTNTPVFKFSTFKFSYLYISYALFHCFRAVSLQTQFLYFVNILRQQFQNHPEVIIMKSPFTITHLSFQWVETPAWIHLDFSNVYAGVKHEPVHALVDGVICAVPGVQKTL